MADPVICMQIKVNFIARLLLALAYRTISSEFESDERKNSEFAGLSGLVAYMHAHRGCVDLYPVTLASPHFSPYAVLTCGGQTFKTKALKNCRAPTWNVSWEVWRQRP